MYVSMLHTRMSQPVSHPPLLLQVSSWGGYVFLINLIPMHVLALMITGRFSHRIYIAYSTVSAWAGGFNQHCSLVHAKA